MKWIELCAIFVMCLIFPFSHGSPISPKVKIKGSASISYSRAEGNLPPASSLTNQEKQKIVLDTVEIAQDLLRSFLEDLHAKTEKAIALAQGSEAERLTKKLQLIKFLWDDYAIGVKNEIDCREECRNRYNDKTGRLLCIKNFCEAELYEACWVECRRATFFINDDGFCNLHCRTYENYNPNYEKKRIGGKTCGKSPTGKN